MSDPKFRRRNPSEEPGHEKPLVEAQAPAKATREMPNGEPDASPFIRAAVVPASGAPAILRVRDTGFQLGAAQRVNLLPAVAWSYERLWRPRSVGLLTGGKLATADELAWMTAWVQPAAGERILDAGCSAGLYARHVAAAAPDAELHAVDISLPFLQEGHDLARREGHSIQFLQADVQRLPYRDDSFDAVVSGGSFNEFRDPAAALVELARVLAPGGRLFLMYLSGAEGLRGRTLQRALAPAGLTFPSPGTVSAWALSAGLATERSALRPPVALALFRNARTGAAKSSGNVLSNG